MNNHTASLEITVNVHESVLSRKLVFWTSNWKHVIKYDLYVKFPRIFAYTVHICAKLCCRNFSDVFQIFRILHHYTWGRFSWTRCTYTSTPIVPAYIWSTRCWWPRWNFTKLFGNSKQATERLQALADISRSALYAFAYCSAYMLT